jgi:PST family polysaccharide transporter
MSSDGSGTETTSNFKQLHHVLPTKESIFEGILKPFDPSGAFRPSEAEGELRRFSVRSAGVTVFSQGVVFAVQMIATIVLARLLAPADFGVVTMVTTFSLLLMSFGQNGYTEAVIQRSEIDHFLASNLFWINLGVGFVLAAGFAAAGSLMARFYHDPRVTHVAVGISLTIFICGTSVVHLALLKRALRFSVTSANDILSGVISVAVTILLAWIGRGYWALVAGAVTRVLIQSIGAWYLCRWIPSFPRRATGTASVVRFALNVYGRFTLNYSARNTDNLLVGWRFGSSSLGFYKKAYDLFCLPANQLLTPVLEVALSALSRLERESEQYRRYFLNGLSILAFVGMGVGGALTLGGQDLIRFLLGPGWEMSGRIFTFFGPGIGIMLIYNTSGLIHLSSGRADRWLRWVIVEFTVTFLLFLVGLRWGPVGIAMAWTASFWILTLPAFWYAGRPIRFSVTRMAEVVWKYVLASLLAGCASSAIIRQIPSLVTAPGAPGAAVRLVTISSLFTVLYLGAVILLHGGCDPLYRFAKLLPDMVPWAKLSRSPALSVASGSQGLQEDSLLASEEPRLQTEEAS